MKKTIIIAKVCTYLSEKNINILDISQTIVDGFFNMMMIVDFTTVDQAFVEVAGELEKIGEEIGCQVRVQREEIFDKMHRL